MIARRGPLAETRAAAPLAIPRRSPPAITAVARRFLITAVAIAPTRRPRITTVRTVTLAVRPTGTIRRHVATAVRRITPRRVLTLPRGVTRHRLLRAVAILRLAATRRRAPRAAALVVADRIAAAAVAAFTVAAEAARTVAAVAPTVVAVAVP